MNWVEDREEGNIHIEAAVQSHIGAREYQQDYAYLKIFSGGAFGILCDGMGGLSGGDIASKTTVMSFAQNFAARDRQKSDYDFFGEQTIRTDREIAALKDDAGKPLQCGTTVVSVSVTGNQMYWLSVGDSRIYLIRADRIVQVTRDHNYKTMLDEYLSNGKISQEKYEQEARGGRFEALTSYIGMDGVQIIDRNHEAVTLEDGDIVVLCCDGLYKTMNNDKIGAMILDNGIDMHLAAERLIDMTLRTSKRGQDNITVMLLKYRA